MNAKAKDHHRSRAARVLLSAAVLATALGVADASRAADYCFGGGLYSFVGKGFKVPTRGKCKPFSGWKTYDLTDDVVLVTGTACTTAGGEFVDMSLVSQRAGTWGWLSFETVRLPLQQGLQGVYGYESPNGGGGTVAISEPGISCPSRSYPLD
jgi:hypothetical protein